MNGVETRVEDVMAYVRDFHEANDEWPTRTDYANFLGVESRALPGVRAAINRKLLGYLSDDRLAPREVVDADFEAWLAEHAAQNRERSQSE